MVRAMTMPLADGYHPLPPGKLANVVTFLETTEQPALRGRHFPAGTALVPADRGDLAAYRAIYSAVGRDLLWFSRLFMADEELARILADPGYEPYVLVRGGEAIGMLDLDFREPGQCELAFFGVVPDAVGSGLGAALMDAAIARAWARPIERLWVHTCTFDHPSALGFYQRSGFRPFKVMVEVHDDPRLTGHTPREASPNAPLIDP
jgi:GNAT superfamily N-acetyltransferase